MARENARRYLLGVNIRRGVPVLLFATAIVANPLRAQSVAPQTVEQWWPEIDYFHQLNDHMRIFLQALGAFGGDREADNVQYGANFDLFLKARPVFGGIFGAASLVEDRYRPALLRVGYRYSETVNGPSNGQVQNRILAEFSINRRFGQFVVTDRNGFDWRWTDGDWSTRYRNRIYGEYTVDFAHYSVTPFVNSEWFYSLQNSNWTAVKMEAGFELPVVRRLSSEIYYGRQVNWQGAPAFINALGITLVYSN